MMPLARHDKKAGNVTFTTYKITMYAFIENKTKIG